MGSSRRAEALCVDAACPGREASARSRDGQRSGVGRPLVPCPAARVMAEEGGWRLWLVDEIGWPINTDDVQMARLNEGDGA